MIKSIKYTICAVFIAVFAIACNYDENEPQEVLDVFEGCCSTDPVFGPNVDNLDQTNGEVKGDNLFTPNGDGFNDRLQIENIELYDNHTVSIYTLEDELIFESTSYVGFSNLFPLESQGEFGVEGLPDGTYKYKIVIENEQTFFKSGVFCLFTNNPPIEQNFSDCNPLAEGEFDPIITGL